jgi:N-acetylglutamate synthase-like GNAT family acetyltransferase
MEQPKSRFTTLTDLDFVSQDKHIPTEKVAHKIHQNEVIVSELEGQLVGYLRLEYLWSLVPYIALITVEDAYRRMGVGKSLLAFSAKYLAEHDHLWLYSSSQADEPEPQAWHRHMGFKDCGIIAGINAGGVSEIFFRKAIGL